MHSLRSLMMFCSSALCFDNFQNELVQNVIDAVQVLLEAEKQFGAGDTEKSDQAGDKTLENVEDKQEIVTPNDEATPAENTDQSACTTTEVKTAGEHFTAESEAVVAEVREKDKSLETNEKSCEKEEEKCEGETGKEMQSESAAEDVDAKNETEATTEHDKQEKPGN